MTNIVFDDIKKFCDDPTKDRAITLHQKYPTVLLEESWMSKYDWYSHTDFLTKLGCKRAFLRMNQLIKFRADLLKEGIKPTCGCIKCSKEKMRRLEQLNC